MNEETLRALRDALHPGQPLDELQWLELRRILDTILEGRDIREEYGIDPKRGSPNSTKSLQKWMVIHFLKVLEDDPQTDEKEHRSRIAFWWGKSPTQFEEVVREHRAELAPIARMMTIEQVEDTARIMQPIYKAAASARKARSTPK